MVKISEFFTKVVESLIFFCKNLLDLIKSLNFVVNFSVRRMSTDPAILLYDKDSTSIKH